MKNRSSNIDAKNAGVFELLKIEKESEI